MNGDGKVTNAGLGKYSKKMTANISKEPGHAQTPLIINFGKDSPLYQQKENGAQAVRHYLFSAPKILLPSLSIETE